MYREVQQNLLLFTEAQASFSLPNINMEGTQFGRVQENLQEGRVPRAKKDLVFETTDALLHQSNRGVRPDRCHSIPMDPIQI